MKNETARREIESLDYYLQNHTDDYSEESHTAMMMGIKALEQKPCEDCISREKAKQFLYERLDRLNDDELYDIFSRVIDDMYNELPSITPIQSWIPVSERLPKKNMACLVAIGKFNLTQMAMYSDLMGTINHRIFYQGDVGYGSFEDITEYVKAWMPLPTPYEPQERSDKE